MHRLSRRSAILCAFLVVLVASAGCVGDGGDADLPGRETVADSLRSIDAVAGTATVTLDVGNDTTQFRVELVQRTGAGEYRASVSRTPPDVDYRIVSNGSSMWLYNESTGVARRLDVPDRTDQWNRSVETVAGMYEALGDAGDAEDVSISPLPVVPGGQGTAGGAPSLPAMGEASVTYRGTATAAGRESHVFGVSPATDASLVENGTLWIDADRYYPVKSDYDMSVAGQSVDVSVTYRNLTFDPEISEGTFAFDPPADATVVDGTRSLTVRQSREALVSAAERPVSDPELPAGYEFVQGSITATNDGRSVTLQYADGTSSLVVSTGADVAASEDAEGETVRVGDHEATYATVDDRARLAWRCADRGYAVVGRLSASEARSIAASIDCE